MADETNDDSSASDDSDSKPVKKTVAARKSSPPSKTDKNNSDNGGNGGNGGPGTGDMNWDKAKETLSEVDWNSRGDNLLRAGLMILAAIAIGFCRFLIYAMATANFLYVMLTKERLNALSELSARLTIYVHQLFDFISYTTDGPVFPFAPFPDLPEDAGK